MTAVLFRCDATARGGIGHFVRSLALAEELAARGRRAVISGEIESPLAQDMLRRTDVTVVPAALTSSQLLERAALVGAGTIHVDRYEGFADLRALAGAPAVVISTASDDEHGRRSADVIVDGSPRAIREFDVLYADADVCLGPDHVVLRRGLARDVTQPTRRENAGANVLVLMGGTDAAGYGPAVARTALRLPGVTRVGMVGSAEQVHGVITVARRPELTELVRGWDLVITAAGTTVWELAALAVPMALIGVAENQRDHYDTLLADGAAIGLGFLPPKDDLAVADLTRIIADTGARRAMADRAHRMVDGSGAARVVDVWDAVARDRRGTSLQLRPAAARDAGRLYRWRNDPVVRRQSRSTGPVSWAEHVAWLRASLIRPDRRLYIATWRSPVGTVRFDALAPGEWEISVTVAPGERGRGLGSQMIDRALTAIASEGRLVKAELRDTNDASRSLFRRSGFVPEDSRLQGWERWVKRF
ncbi:MAG: family N-acetyltransferase [Microbacterium sp.]|jgi:spore coat polysaccharide biosynthesis predicted glycosyltransferase SpsG/RimJ/RimL family protein N-acetyltransferase|uniref:bifunctional UDP-2,4-diacetamido-2,4,6-trideoxy-beta-L-altropyranose hydrolase/GNAT family N-acetyltransferase n=1 Tax=Microbacterium sp. TaxID=51671 RepID=UPI002629AD23|nr:bifunctional UDP-2,4-diacetamido-2,4,6-trideoxy-beta-L-altropyranose hydrolase/GNAT family N-acetyltransferase [Microbacterium sp.]MDF2562789.1 family N-acetyltransferase [Microbacterium sp.]